MTDETRCEPPPELRGVDGWHWVQSTFGDPVIRRWLAGPHSAWRHLSMPSTPELAYQAGYRYLAPVTPPATVAALVEALEDMVCEQQSEAQVGTGEYQRGYDDCIAAHADTARAALALYRGEAGR